MVASAFRNSSPTQVRQWCEQLKSLQAQTALQHEIFGLAVEGDSADDTFNRLIGESQRSCVHVDVLKRDFGAPHYPSTEDPARMAALSKVGNAIFDGIPTGIDVLVYVESDLIWDADTIKILINECLANDCIIAPLIFAGPSFYDIWAFRKNGVRFSPFHPYHPDLKPAVLTEVDSAGSCLVMPAYIARQIRIQDNNALVGWCASARAAGHKIMVDPLLTVRHPA